MTEFSPVPEAPPTNVLFGSFDEKGEYSIQPLPFVRNSEGRTVPCSQPPEVMDQAQDWVGRWRQTQHARVQEGLASVRRADTEDLHLGRIDHYYRALGLPTAPVLVAESTGDLPKSGPAAHEAGFFHRDPTLSAMAFHTPRLIVAARSIKGSSHDPEHIIVHEKAHTTGLETVVLMPNPQGKLTPFVARSGFTTSTPVDAQHLHLLKSKGDSAEEAPAEMFAGTYARLFLPRPETTTIDRQGPHPFEVDGKYDHGTATSSSAPLGLALELLIERDPQILEHLIAARLSIDGLRQFARGVNAQLRGFYRAILHRQAGWDSNITLMRRVVNGLYDGDDAVLKKTGGAVTSFVVGKLQDYEQRTGYSFGLPASVARGAVILGSDNSGATTRSASSGEPPQRAQANDPITELLHRATDTMR